MIGFGPVMASDDTRRNIISRPGMFRTLLFFLPLALTLFIMMIFMIPSGDAAITISTNTTFEDQTVELNGSMTVGSNATLTFRNCTVLMNSIVEEDINLSVGKGCSLRIENSTFRRMSEGGGDEEGDEGNERGQYHFFIEGNASITGTEFLGMGGTDNRTAHMVYGNNTYGFWFHGSADSRFDNVTFNASSGITILADNCTLTLSYVSLFTSDIFGIVGFRSVLYIDNSSILNDQGKFFSYGISVRDSSILVKHTRFHGGKVNETFIPLGLFCQNSTVIADECSFSELVWGLWILDLSRGAVQNCTFEMNYNGVRTEVTEFEIRDSTFIDNNAAIEFYSNIARTVNNTFITTTPIEEIEDPLTYNAYTFNFKVRIRVNVYYKGDTSQFYSFGDGVQIIQKNGHIVQDTHNVDNGTRDYTIIHDGEFTNFTDDIVSTPLVLRAYYQHNYTIINTTLGELLNADLFNISVIFYPEKLPDLTIIDFSLSTRLIDVGDTVMIWFVVGNIGTVASQDVYVKIWMYGDTIHTVTIPELEPGGAYRGDCLWEVDYHGYHEGKVDIYVDPNREIKEYEDQNNRASADIEITFPNSSGGNDTTGEEIGIIVIIVLCIVGFASWSSWDKGK